MSRVLDSSAIVAFVMHEPGSENLGPSLKGSLISAVNLSETINALERRGGMLTQITSNLEELGIIVVEFDAALAVQTAALAGPSRHAGLSLGDRACLALATREQLPAVTADRAWSRVRVGVEIQLIR